MDRAVSQADVDAVIDRELPALPGWCTPEKGRRMAALARGGLQVVELGVFGGRGLIAMALALRDQGFGSADGIDPYTAAAALEGTNDQANDEWWGKIDYAEIARTAQGAIDRLGLSTVARIVRVTSREAVRAYDDESVACCYQDSNHSMEVTCEEVALWAPKIRRGGYWIFDDTNWPTTQRAQRDLVALGFAQLEDHATWKVYRRP